MRNNIDFEKLKKARSFIDYYPEYEILEDLHLENDVYVVKVRITLLNIKNSYVPNQTDWYIVFEDEQQIDFYPAKTNSITATFPHQSLNTIIEGYNYRTGKPCLDVPGHTLNLPDEYYPYEKGNKIYWYLGRMVEWLKNAADNTLLKKGEPFEVPTNEYSGTELLYKENKLEDWSIFDYPYGYVKLNQVKLDKNYFVLDELYDINLTEARGTIFWGDFKNKFSNNIYDSLWIRCPRFPIKYPWEYPNTWEELFSIFNENKLDIFKVISELLMKNNSYKKRPNYLLLACPIPEKIGESAKSYYWLMCDIPEINYPRNGFRKGVAGFKACVKIALKGKINWHRTHNWDDSVIRTRGQMRRGLGDLTYAIIGAGSLGSHVAEHLVRQGAKHLKIIDGDLINIGNLARHVLCVEDLNRAKTKSLAKMLVNISPSVQIDTIDNYLDNTNVSKLENTDVIIDCSGNNDVLEILSNYQFSDKKEIYVGSFNYGATRFGYYKIKTERFNCDVYNLRTTEFYNEKTIDESNLIMEGIGCYHPVFPATYSDVSIWASIFVKEIINTLDENLKEKLKFFELENGAVKILKDEEVQV